MIIMASFLSGCDAIRGSYREKLAAGLISPRGEGTGVEDIALDLVCEVPGLVDRAAMELRSRFNFDRGLVLDYCAYTRLEAGRGHELHADGVKLDGSPNHTPHRVATAMVYLNDGETDFGNGVLVFPEMGVRVSSRVGLFVGFLTDLRYRHYVTPVSRGSREAIAIWFKH